MTHQLMLLLGQEGQTLIGALEMIAKYEIARSFAETDLEKRTDIGATEKLQLAKASVGQGLFKSRVELVEKCCRITKVERPEYITASHIKPWCASSDPDQNVGAFSSEQANYLEYHSDVVLRRQQEQST